MDPSSIFTPWRLTWYPRVILFALGVGFLISIVSGKGANTISGRLGGDYPSFYGAGRIISQGDWKELYNPDRQLSAQKGLVSLPGSDNRSYIPFPYPPYVALFYWPLSLLNYRLSYILHTLLMVLALFITRFDGPASVN